MSNNVNHPSHYNQGGIECIDAIKSATVNKKGIEAVCVANVIKYLFRYETKNGLEDVRKSQWYINRLIQELEEKENKSEQCDSNTKYPDWTESEEEDCCNCKFMNVYPKDEPCVNCKNNYAPESEKHKTFPLKFQPDGLQTEDDII